MLRQISQLSASKTNQSESVRRSHWFPKLTVGSAKDKTDIKYNVQNKEFHIFTHSDCMFISWLRDVRLIKTNGEFLRYFDVISPWFSNLVQVIDFEKKKLQNHNSKVMDGLGETFLFFRSIDSPFCNLWNFTALQHSRGNTVPLSAILGYIVGYIIVGRARQDRMTFSYRRLNLVLVVNNVGSWALVML